MQRVFDSSGIDIVAFKARAFSAILDAEEPHSANVPELFKMIREDIRTLRNEG